MHHNVWSQVRHAFLVEALPADFLARSFPIDEAAFASGHDMLREFRHFDYWGDGSLVMVDLPGHAEGHTGYYLQLASESIFYIVDACWDVEVLRNGWRIPWISRRLQADYAAYERTPHRLRAWTIRTGQQVYACHCERTPTDETFARD